MKNKIIEGILGKHCSKSDFFAEWLDCEDMAIHEDQPNKKHRKLTEIDGQREYAINQIAYWLIKHHYLEPKIDRLSRKKNIYEKYAFEKYIEENNILPTADKTQKGALGEILFTEYLISITDLVVSYYRLRFNGNMEQSLKGDDILFFDKGNISNKILLGESKYISNASSTGKATIKDIVNNLQFGKLPLSLGQVEAELDKIGESSLADEISELLSILHENKNKIVYAGFLMGNKEVHPPSADIVHQVETHLSSNNPQFVLVSLGIINSVDIIKKAFERANEILNSLDEDEKLKIYKGEERQLVTPIRHKNK